MSYFFQRQSPLRRTYLAGLLVVPVVGAFLPANGWGVFLGVLMMGWIICTIIRFRRATRQLKERRGEE